MGTIKKVFILHGWTYSLDKWKEFNNLLKKEGFEPILLKIPGLTQKINKPWQIEDYISWLGKLLEKEKNPIVLGHSNGGRIALAYALKNPKKLDQLILIDSAGIYHNELPLRLKRAVFKGAAKLGKKLTSSEKLRTLLYKAAREKDYQEADPISRQTMLNLTSLDLSPDLHKITTKTLLIWGVNDKSTPLEDGKFINKQIKGSKLYPIKDARHSPQFTHPKEVVKIINEYL